MTGSLNVGPRVMITRAGLDRTGLITLGSRAAERYLFALPAHGGPDVEQKCAPILKQAFPEATIADYRETHPIITRGLDRATTFLSLIGLIALVIGAMGVASAMHGHLQQKLDSIAVMKCIGARSGQVIRIYTAQTLMLGPRRRSPRRGRRRRRGRGVPGPDREVFRRSTLRRLGTPGRPLQGIAVACLVTLLFTLPPLLGIRDIRPALIFRRDVERKAAAPARHAPAHICCAPSSSSAPARSPARSPKAASRRCAPHRRRLRHRPGHRARAALARRMALAARLPPFLRRAGAACPASLRHGIANLYRPGNQAQAAVVALGVGVMFTLTVFLVQSSRWCDQIRGSAPPGMPNVFLLDIPGQQRDRARATSSSRSPASKSAPDVAFAVAARITAIDGAPIDQLPLRDFDRRFLRTRSVTRAGRHAGRDRHPERRLVAPPATAIRRSASTKKPPKSSTSSRAPSSTGTSGTTPSAHARGLHPAHRIHPHDRALRVHLQSGPAAGHARRSTTAARACGPPTCRRCSASSTRSSPPSPWSMWPT